jgi:hypothetical protein
MKQDKNIGIIGSKENMKKKLKFLKKWSKDKLKKILEN